MKNRRSNFGKYPFEKPPPIQIANERNLEFARLQREVREVQRINAIHDSSLALARQVIKRVRDKVNAEMSGHRIIPESDPVSFEVKVILQTLRVNFETFENIKREKIEKDLLLQNQVVKRRLYNLRIRDEGVSEKARNFFETFYNLVSPVFDIYLMDTVLTEGIQNPNLLMARSKELTKYIELLLGFQEDLRKLERGVFTNINTSSFGGKLTQAANDALASQAVKQERYFIRGIYRKLDSESDEFLYKINAINLPNIIRKFKIEILIYIKVLRKLFHDLADRLVSDHGFEARKQQRDKRALSMSVLDQTIDIVARNGFGNGFGIVESAYRNFDVVDSEKVARNIIIIDELVQYYRTKFKQLSEDTADSESLIKMMAIINRLVGEILSNIGVPRELIARI